MAGPVGPHGTPWETQLHLRGIEAIEVAVGLRNTKHIKTPWTFMDIAPFYTVPFQFVTCISYFFHDEQFHRVGCLCRRFERLLHLVDYVDL